MSRIVWVVCGFACVGLGILGLAIPMVPGVVFLMIAAWCFSKGSQRYHTWLLAHRHLGPPIRNWKNDRAISLGNKWFMTMLLVLSIFATCLLKLPLNALAIQGAGITCALVFIWSRPAP